jgi:hypothetical protein
MVRTVKLVESLQDHLDTPSLIRSLREASRYLNAQPVRIGKGDFMYVSQSLLERLSEEARVEPQEYIELAAKKDVQVELLCSDKEVPAL